MKHSSKAKPTEPATAANEQSANATNPSPGATDTTPLSAQEIETLKAKAAQSDTHRDNYLRALADLDNYRKRAARERTEAISYANQSLLQKLIPTLDNFEMALAAAQNSAADDSIKSHAAGVTMIHAQLKTALAEAGLEEIQAIGKPFDPNFHEAISEQESSEVPDHHVLQQIRRGYKLRDRLLRPATVIVAKAPAAK